MTSLNRIAIIALGWLLCLADRTRHTTGTGVADDAGMSTAEYAVGTVAAVGFAVVLYKVVRSPAVATALSSIIKSALHAI